MSICGALSIDKFCWNSNHEVGTDLWVVDEGNADKMRLEYVGQANGIIHCRVSLDPDGELTTISLIIASRSFILLPHYSCAESALLDSNAYASVAMDRQGAG